MKVPLWKEGNHIPDNYFFFFYFYLFLARQFAQNPTLIKIENNETLYIA